MSQTVAPRRAAPDIVTDMTNQMIRDKVLLTSGELARRLGAELIGPDDIPLRRLDALEHADSQTLTFIRDARHAAKWADSRAGAALVSRGATPAEHDSATRALLVVDDADLAMIEALRCFSPPHAEPGGQHASAVVDDTASLGAEVRLGPCVSIGPGCVIGDATILHANVALGADVVIGKRCDIRAGVVIEDRCALGDRVTIHPNTVIGADGFGYRPTPGDDGAVTLRKVPHAGAVRIDDDVEIGAGVTIDRGKFGDTVIEAGAKIDNLVQIAHNCRIGRSCIVCGCCGLSGSVTLGEGVTLAGGVGVADNVTIGAGATVAARSGVMHDIPPGETWIGYPAAPYAQSMRAFAANRRLPEALKQLSALRRALNSDANDA